MKHFKKANKKFNMVAMYITIIFTCVILLTIGYSAFQESLVISDISAAVRVQADIRVTNASVTNGTNNAYANYTDYGVKNITSTLILPNQNSTITYHIEVTNIGNVKQGIYAIDEIYKIANTNTNSNLEIKSKTVNLKEALCDDNNASQCKLGAITTFDITIGYKNNGYDGTNSTHLVELDFDFRRIFDITYSGFANTSGLPTEMIYGDTKVITFDNTTGIPSSVIVTGATGSYSSPNLTLSNITIQNLVDTIVVTKAYSVTYVGFTGNTSGLISSITGAGASITFNNTTGIPAGVTVTGATGNYSSPTLTLTNVTGDVVISSAYTITYIDFTGNTSGLISSITGAGASITFNNTTGIPASVTVTGATGNYSSPTLTLTNVTGNVTITAIFNGNVEVINNNDGTTTTITTTENQNGSTTAVAVTTDQNGNTVSETETTTNTDGSATSTTINYDSNHNPTTGSTSNVDTSGNINTQEVEYNSSGQSHVSGYTIDTSGKQSGGETVASLDTGLIVFDGQGFEMSLVFKCNMSENVGNNIFGAIQKVNNKYAGFNLAIPSNSKVNMYAGKNSSLYSSGAVGSNIHSGSQYWSISSANNTKVTEYTLTMTYLPKNYGTNTNTKYGWVSVSLTPVQTSGNQYYQQNPLEKTSASIPEDLAEATFTLGGNGINNSYDMVGFEVVSFSIHKI